MHSRSILSRCILTISVFILFSLFFPAALGSEPNGANVTVGASTTAPIASAASAEAQAGNVTELNLFGYSSTQAWQGYFGNVSGVIQLADSGNKVLYNWTQASPKGEVYASTNTTIFWSNIQCFNFTASGNYTAEAGSGGTTSKFGTNLTQLEGRFNIASDDVDGVDATFPYSGTGTHNMFYTANQQFTEGQCKSTRVYDASGQGVDNNFEEVLLYEPVSTSVVFASLLNQNAPGFDSRSHDFEMLVLDDGHGANTASTPYYFYVEIQ